jgi:hypothetical protein
MLTAFLRVRRRRVRSYVKNDISLEHDAKRFNRAQTSGLRVFEDTGTEISFSTLELLALGGCEIG